MRNQHKNQDVTPINLCSSIVSERAVNEVSGIGGLQGGSITRAASVLGLTTSPLSATAASDFSFQTLSDICFSTTSSSHFTFFFSLIASLCARDM